MKRTYTGTWTMSNEELQKAIVKIYSFDANKYTGIITEEKEWKFTGVKAWDIVEGGAEADEIEAKGAMLDENHEYLILHFVNGCTMTFRNSYVDMHIR